MIKTAMAEPDSLKLPINETTRLLAAPDLPDGGSAQSDADVNGRHSGSEVEEHAVGAVAGEDEDGPKGAGRSISPKVAVAILTIGVFIAQLDGSFVLATHSVIASDFAQLEDSIWLIASYGLAMSAAQPLYGKLSDIYGRKQLLLVSYIFFAIGCALCGLAQSMTAVVIGRVLSGIGGAGVQGLVSLVLLDLFPLREVATLRSYVNIVATTGRSLGGPIGGALADTVGWRWSFLGQSPLIIFSGALAAWIIPGAAKDRPHENGSKKGKFRRIDFAGAFLLAATITSFLLAIEIGGQKVPWTSPLIALLFTTAIICAAFFYVTEKYWAPEPIFPLQLLSHKEVMLGYLVILLQVAAQLGMMFCVPLFFQVTENATSGVAGAHLMPAVIGNAVAGLISGAVIKKTGRYKFLAVGATLVAATCYATLIIRWRGRISIWESLEIIPGGFGMGMSEAAIFISLSATVDQSLQAIALSGLFLSSGVGMISGLAASSAVLQLTLRGELERRLQDYPEKQTIIENTLSDISYVLNSKGPLHEILVESYLRGLEWTHAVSLACVGTACIAALFTREKRL